MLFSKCVIFGVFFLLLNIWEVYSQTTWFDPTTRAIAHLVRAGISWLQGLESTCRIKLEPWAIEWALNQLDALGVLWWRARPWSVGVAAMTKTGHSTAGRGCSLCLRPKKVAMLVGPRHPPRLLREKKMVWPFFKIQQYWTMYMQHSCPLFLVLSVAARLLLG